MSDQNQEIEKEQSIDLLTEVIYPHLKRRKDNIVNAKEDPKKVVNTDYERSRQNEVAKKVGLYVDRPLNIQEQLSEKQIFPDDYNNEKIDSSFFECNRESFKEAVAHRNRVVEESYQEYEDQISKFEEYQEELEEILLDLKIVTEEREEDLHLERIKDANRNVIEMYNFFKSEDKVEE